MEKLQLEKESNIKRIDYLVDSNTEDIRWLKITLREISDIPRDPKQGSSSNILEKIFEVGVNNIDNFEKNEPKKTSNLERRSFNFPEFDLLTSILSSSETDKVTLLKFTFLQGAVYKVGNEKFNQNATDSKIDLGELGGIVELEAHSKRKIYYC